MMGSVEALRKLREAQKRISLELEMRTNNKHSKEERYSTCFHILYSTSNQGGLEVESEHKSDQKVS